MWHHNDQIPSPHLDYLVWGADENLTVSRIDSVSIVLFELSDSFLLRDEIKRIFFFLLKKFWLQSNICDLLLLLLLDIYNIKYYNKFD